MLKSAIGLLCTILIAFSSTAQVSWQQEYASTVPNYSLATTQNGYAFAYNYAPTGGTLLASPSGGASGTWAPVAGTPAGAGSLYASNDALFLSGKFGIMRSTDNGATWKSANNGLIGNDSTNLKNIIHVYGKNLILLHSGDNVKKVYYSSNNGLNWSATLNMYGQSVGSVVVSGNRIYLITSGTVYVSYNGGGYWDNLYATFPAGAAGGRTLAFADQTFIMQSGTKFYTSNNEGVNWTELNSTGLPANATALRFIKSPVSDTIYMSTKVTGTSTYGLYYSADKGVTWNPFDNGLPAKAIGGYAASQLIIGHDGHMLSSPDSNGIYRTANPVTESRVILPGVSVGSAAKNTIGLSLSPNPAFQTLYVSFSVETPGNCKAFIADLFGKSVMRQEFNASVGRIKVRLDISSLPVGTYILYVRTGRGLFTEKFSKQ